MGKSTNLTKLKKDEVIALAEAALARLPKGERENLIEAFVPAKKPKPKRKKRPSPKPSSLRRKVKAFVDESLAGEYYIITGDKNERGFYKTPQSTKDWCRKVEKLCADTLLLAKDGEDEVVADVLEQLLDVMGKSEGDREIVWADEWGVDWNVHADFKKLLRTFFEALSKTASPEDFARRGAAIALQYTWKYYDSEKLLRRYAKGERLKALEEALENREEEKALVAVELSD